MCGMPRICSVYKEIGADGKRGWSSELDLIIHCQLEKANNTRIFQKNHFSIQKKWKTTHSV